MLTLFPAWGIFAPLWGGIPTLEEITKYKMSEFCFQGVPDSTFALEERWQVQANVV